MRNEPKRLPSYPPTTDIADEAPAATGEFVRHPPREHGGDGVTPVFVLRFDGLGAPSPAPSRATMAARGIRPMTASELLTFVGTDLDTILADPFGDCTHAPEGPTGAEPDVIIDVEADNDLPEKTGLRATPLFWERPRPKLYEDGEPDPSCRTLVRDLGDLLRSDRPGANPKHRLVLERGDSSSLARLKHVIPPDGE